MQVARNGSGTYNLPAGNPVVTGTTISSTTHNNTMTDIETALTDSVDKDGQTVITGVIDHNGEEIVLDVDGDTSITADTDDQIDVKVGGSDIYKILAASLGLATDDGASLGISGTAWSDLFLASGGVINWDSGDITITHSANDLAFAGGTFTFTTLDSTSFKAAANNFGAPANFTNTIGTQSAPDFLYNDSTKKLYCRSIIVAEQNDTSEIAIRRVNGTLTSPTAVLTGELSGVLYWQPWIATDWGSGSPNYGRTGQIQSRLTEPTPTRTNTGGNVGIAVTKHGSDVLRERFWVNNDGDVVCAGQAGDAGHAGLESTTTSYPATHTIYSQDAGDHATCAWRHDDDISEGFDWDITQATNILTLLRVLSDARTSILTIDGSGINGVIGATTAAAGTFTAATIDNITIDGNTISCATGSNLEIVPFAGQNIRLDGAIVIDAGVVTGATSITSTGFTGALTGNVTGNVSGTAATVTGAAQAAITSLGTLTTLTVDNITINGAAISSDTGAISFSDEDITTTGQVNAANFSSSTNVISDDSVISFVTVSGAILKLGTGGSPANGRPNGFVRIEASETPYEIVLERTTNIAFATGVHTGTTGSDGNLTIAVNTTTCYIENRTGGAIGIDLTMFSR